MGGDDLDGWTVLTLVVKRREWEVGCIRGDTSCKKRNGKFPPFVIFGSSGLESPVSLDELYQGEDLHAPKISLLLPCGAMRLCSGRVWNEWR